MSVLRGWTNTSADTGVEPDGVQPGDVLIVIASTSVTGGHPAAPTVPEGWESLGSRQSVNTGAAGVVIATVTREASAPDYTFDGAGRVFVIATVGACAITTPAWFEVQQVPLNRKTWTVPGVSGVLAGAVLVAAAFTDVTEGTWTPSSGFSEWDHSLVTFFEHNDSPGVGTVTIGDISADAQAGAITLSFAINPSADVDITIAADGIAAPTLAVVSARRFEMQSVGAVSTDALLIAPLRITASATGLATAEANVAGAPQIPIEASGISTAVAPVRSRVTMAGTAAGAGAASGRVVSPVPMAMTAAGGSSTAGQVGVVRRNQGSRTPPPGFATYRRRPPAGIAFRSSGKR